MNHSQLIAGRYEIIGTLGQGGMGDVYRGRDTQTGDMVAIKLLKPDIVESDPSLIERFEREGEALRQLNHPNIVTMLAAVEENDLHYLVMQYVSGGSLRDLLDRQPQLPVERVLSIGIELADALTRAHHLKIIHRDLKPENVMLDEHGTPLLADFGVARIGTRTRVTAAGAVIGTYAYLSPEACSGEDLDARADIWSFGVMLYEMLAGRRPFGAEQPTALLLQIMQEDPPALAGFRPDAPPALVDLVHHMLRKERGERIHSVRLVGAALEAIMQGTDTPFPFTSSQIAARQADASRFATPTPPESTTSDLIRMPETRPLPAASRPDPASAVTPAAPVRTRSRRLWIAGGIAALAVVAALVVILALGTGGGENNSPPESPALVDPVGPGEYMVLVAQLEPLGGVAERDVARFIVEDLTQRLEQEVPFSHFRVRTYPRVITSEDDAQAAAEANDATAIVWGNYTPDQIDLEVQIGTTTAFPHVAIERDLLDLTASTRVRLSDERRESIASPVLGVFNVLLAADGDGYGISRLLTVVDTIRAPLPEIVSGGVVGYLQRSQSLFMDDTVQALDGYNAAVEVGGGNPLVYIYRATAYIRLGDYEKARRDIDTAMRLGPADWTAPLYLKGTYLGGLGDTAGALELLDEIIRLRPDDWFAWNYRAASYYLQGDYARAREDYAQAITLGPDANFPYIVSLLIALHEGRLADMAHYLDTIVTEFPDPAFSTRMVQALFGEEVPNIFGPMFAAAGNLILGQYDRVIPETGAALAVLPLADMYLAQGVAYCNLGDYAAAEEAYTQGIALEPDYVALYALRAEVRLRQDNMPDSLADGEVVLQSDLGDTFAPLIEAGLAGEWRCENFFSYDYTRAGRADE